MTPNQDIQNIQFHSGEKYDHFTLLYDTIGYKYAFQNYKIYQIHTRTIQWHEEQCVYFIIFTFTFFPSIYLRITKKTQSPNLVHMNTFFLQYSSKNMTDSRPDFIIIPKVILNNTLKNKIVYLELRALCTISVSIIQLFKWLFC